MQQLGVAACDSFCCCLTKTEAALGEHVSLAPVGVTGAVIVLHGTYILCKPSAGMTHGSGARPDVVQAGDEQQMLRHASRKQPRRIQQPDITSSSVVHLLGASVRELLLGHAWLLLQLLLKCYWLCSSCRLHAVPGRGLQSLDHEQQPPA